MAINHTHTHAHTREKDGTNLQEYRIPASFETLPEGEGGLPSLFVDCPLGHLLPPPELLPSLAHRGIVPVAAHAGAVATLLPLR